jgi:REP element-mobilizing transposase RayT
MATYTQILYHIVFGTKDHVRCLDLARHDSLCGYIAGILKHKNCMPYKLGGYLDHVHILVDLHPACALSELIKDIKLGTSHWIKNETVFADFSGWQDGYGAFTCSWKDKDRIVSYIANQQEHHRRKTFREEYIEMLKRSGIEFNEKFLC